MAKQLGQLVFLLRSKGFKQRTNIRYGLSMRSKRAKKSKATAKKAKKQEGTRHDLENSERI